MKSLDRPLYAFANNGTHNIDFEAAFWVGLLLI